ncbi:MAG TPA: hypothetical protein VGJ84_22925 [Polyangiaceae bacterium]
MRRHAAFFGRDGNTWENNDALPGTFQPCAVKRPIFLHLVERLVKEAPLADSESAIILQRTVRARLTAETRPELPQANDRGLEEELFGENSVVKIAADIYIQHVFCFGNG